MYEHSSGVTCIFVCRVIPEEGISVNCVFPEPGGSPTKDLPRIVRVVIYAVFTKRRTRIVLDPSLRSRVALVYECPLSQWRVSV